MNAFKIVFDLFKGRKALPIGTMRTYNGVKHVKTAKGWIPQKGANNRIDSGRGGEVVKQKTIEDIDSEMVAVIERVLERNLDKFYGTDDLKGAVNKLIEVMQNIKAKGGESAVEAIGAFKKVHNIVNMDSVYRYVKDKFNIQEKQEVKVVENVLNEVAESVEKKVEDKKVYFSGNTIEEAEAYMNELKNKYEGLSIYSSEEYKNSIDKIKEIHKKYNEEKSKRERLLKLENEKRKEFSKLSEEQLNVQLFNFNNYSGDQDLKKIGIKVLTELILDIESKRGKTESEILKMDIDEITKKYNDLKEMNERGEISREQLVILSVPIYEELLKLNNRKQKLELEKKVYDVQPESVSEEEGRNKIELEKIAERPEEKTNKQKEAENILGYKDTDTEEIRNLVKEKNKELSEGLKLGVFNKEKRIARVKELDEKINQLRKEQVEKPNEVIKPESNETRGEDKQKRKERSDKGKKRVMTKKDAEDFDKLDKEIEDSNKKAKTIETPEDLRNAEGYYNEKPNEIMNVGRDIWSAKRLAYNTYEQAGATLEKMEQDGVAEKMVTKNKFLGLSGFGDFSERIKSGEDGLKICINKWLRDAILSSPEYGQDEEMNKSRRAVYVRICSEINKISNSTNSGLDLYSNIVDLLHKEIGFSELNKLSMMNTVEKEKWFANQKKLYELSKIVGIPFLTAFIPHIMQRVSVGRQNKRELNKLKEFKDIMEVAFNNVKLLDDEKNAMRIFKGSEVDLGEDVKDLKRGNIILVKQDYLDGISTKKSNYKSPEKAKEFQDKIAEYNSQMKLVENQLMESAFLEISDPKEVEKELSNYRKNDFYYNGIMKKFYNKDGGVSKLGIKEHRTKEGVDGYMKTLEESHIKKFYEREIFKKAREDENFAKKYGLDDSGEVTIEKIKSELEKRKIERPNREDYMDVIHDKPSENKVKVVSKTKDYLTGLVKFSSGKEIEVKIPYDSVEKVFTNERGKKEKLSPLFYVEKEAIRKGGKDFSKLSVSEMQKKLMEEYKISGIIFGNSLGKDREFHLRKTIEAFDDLSEILGIDRETISANGNLAMGYGVISQLSKDGYCALYDGDNKAISLTRNKGFASLAHEWAHFVDHSLNNYMGHASSEARSREIDQLPKEIKEKTMVLFTEKNRKGKDKITSYYYFPSVKKDKGRQSFGYDWYKTVNGKLDLSKGYSLNPNMKKEKGITIMEPIDLSGQSKVGKITAIMEGFLNKRKEYYDTLPDGDMSKILFMDMYENGAYNSPEEFFARGFECYVSDKFEKLGRENTYLASVRKTKSLNAQDIFPQTKEDREAIYNAFEDLFSDKEFLKDLRKSFKIFFTLKK